MRSGLPGAPSSQQCCNRLCYRVGLIAGLCPLLGIAVLPGWLLIGVPSAGEGNQLLCEASVIRFEQSGALVRGVGLGGRGGCGAVGAALGQPLVLAGLGGQGTSGAPSCGLQGCSLLRQWRPIEGVVAAREQFLLVFSISGECLIWTCVCSWLHPTRASESPGAARSLPMTLCCPALPHTQRSLGVALSHPTVVDSDSVILMLCCSMWYSWWVCTCCRLL